MSLDVQEITDALRTNRKEFAAMFLQAQSEIPIQERVEFEVIGLNEPDDHNAFKAAITYAIGKRFLANLLELVVRSSLESGQLFKLLVKLKANTTDSTLESISNAETGFSEPDDYYRGIAKGMKWTGKVLINGAAQGTGILIGPDLFLTAWHVTRSIFDPITYVPMADSKNLTIEFDNFLFRRNGIYDEHTSSTIKAHENWYVNHSLCHKTELTQDLPGDPKELEECLDYTIIKLKKAIGFERGWVKLDRKAIVPEENKNIILFQHPSGQTMRIDQSTITTLKPVNLPIMGLRFFHFVNSEYGSSGGPCFDKEFSLIGIHQGKCAITIDGKKSNRGIPIIKIIDYIKNTIDRLPLPLPSESPFYWLDMVNYEPIIGCDDFQTAIWASVNNPKTKLFQIIGEDGSGKSFLIRVANAILSDEMHLKIIAPAEIISKMSALEFLGFIGNAVGLPFAKLSSYTEYDSTVAAWLKNYLLSEFIHCLENARKGRTVWISVTDMNKFEIQGENLAEFLMTIAESLKSFEWLRVIVDGLQRNLPISTEDFRLTYRTKTVTLVDIEVFLNRVFARLDINSDAKLIAKALYVNYRDNLDNIDPRALTKLKKSVKLTLSETD